MAELSDQSMIQQLGDSCNTFTSSGTYNIKPAFGPGQADYLVVAGGGGGGTAGGFRWWRRSRWL
jgi:hypothetical protein